MMTVLVSETHRTLNKIKYVLLLTLISRGYVTVAHALDFSNDLKLAYYLKIPQRQTFFAQVAATVVSTFVGKSYLLFLYLPGMYD